MDGLLRVDTGYAVFGCIFEVRSEEGKAKLICVETAPIARRGFLGKQWKEVMDICEYHGHKLEWYPDENRVYEVTE